MYMNDSGGNTRAGNGVGSADLGRGMVRPLTGDAVTIVPGYGVSIMGMKQRRAEHDQEIQEGGHEAKRTE